MIHNPDEIEQLAAAARDIVVSGEHRKTDTTLHHYYSAKAGELTANIIKDWHDTGYKPIALSCHDLRINSNTLYQQIHHGLNWLADNLDDKTVREYFNKIRDTTKLQRRPETNTVELSRCNTRPSFRIITNNVFADIVSDLTSWVDSDPPLRAKWPAKPRYWDLTDDQIKWFKDYLGELKSRNLGFEAMIRKDLVMFVKIPMTLVVKDPTI